MAVARYIPKHRRSSYRREQRRALSGLAFGVSALLGLSGTYGFVPGIQANTLPIAAKVASTTSTAAKTGADATASTTEAFDIKPAFVEIERVGVTSSLIPLSLRTDGTLQVPTVASQAGWFSEGVVPGETGPAVIVGHVDSYLGSAVFGRLRELKPDDVIRVVMNDGSTLSFSVRRIDQYPKDIFPTSLVYGKTDRAELRLVTCAGQFDKSARSYSDNIVVYAVKI
jgi:sortase (surface protein transpeptidase)